MSWSGTDFRQGQSAFTPVPNLLTQDLTVNENFPGIVFTGTESNAQYTEEREINGVYYRVVNAKWNGTNHVCVNTANPAYGYRIDTDGRLEQIYAAATSGSITWGAGTGIIVPTIGPSAAQQHAIPAVTSDTIALLAAVQTLTNKTITGATMTSPVNLGNNLANYWQFLGATTGNPPTAVITGGDTNIGAVIQLKGTTIFGIHSPGGTWFEVTGPANPTTPQWMQATGEDGVSPGLDAHGSAANIGAEYHAKGTAIIGFGNYDTPSKWAQITGPANANTNYFQQQAQGTGTAPILAALGVDTNIDINLVPKGAGVVRINGNALNSQVLASANGVAVSGTTSETTIATATLAGNTLGANGRLRYILHFESPTTSGSVTVRFYLGSTVVWSSTFALSTANNAAMWDGFLANQNATGSQGGVMEQVGGTSLSVGTMGGSGSSGVAFASSSVDTTTNQTIKVTVQPSASGISLTAYFARIEAWA